MSEFYQFPEIDIPFGDFSLGDLTRLAYAQYSCVYLRPLLELLLITVAAEIICLSLIIGF